MLNFKQGKSQNVSGFVKFSWYFQPLLHFLSRFLPRNSTCVFPRLFCKCWLEKIMGYDKNRSFPSSHSGQSRFCCWFKVFLLGTFWNLLIVEVMLFSSSDKQEGSKRLYLRLPFRISDELKVKELHKDIVKVVLARQVRRKLHKLNITRVEKLTA